MSDAYQDAVTKLMNYLDQTIDFAKGQLPDIAREILSYNTSMDFLWIGISFLLLLIGVGLFLWGKSDQEGGPMFAGGVMSVLATLMIGVCITDLIKINQAPKLYIMDELASRLKPKK